MQIRREKTAIVPGIMRIDTAPQAIDMQQIDNRRFMFHPGTGMLVMGRQYAVTSMANSSHAQELADAGIRKDYDGFVRGWVGTGGEYPYGVIHFGPSVDERNIAEWAEKMTDRVFASGSYHEALNIIGEYVNITDSEREPEHRASVRQQIKETKTAEPDKKQKTPKQQER